MEDLADLEVEVSVMGPIAKCEDPSQIVVGRHGLIMRKGEK
jgi:AMMECR1 domain-containing protein